MKGLFKIFIKGSSLHSGINSLKDTDMDQSVHEKFFF